MSSPETLAWMAKEHPDVAAKRNTPHRFVPYPITEEEGPDHRCKGGCACAECWSEYRDKVAHPRRLQGTT